MIYIVVLLILFLLETSYFMLASKFNIIDKPNLRSSHTKVTLRGGGVVFLLAAWIFWVLFGFQYSWFMLGLTIIGVVSFIDDIHILGGKIRLVAQFAAAFLMLYQIGYLFESWWVILIALVVCVGITNAYNFMDGINGITGAYSIAVLLPLIYLNHLYSFISMPFLYVAELSLIVFCFFNFRKKARCFAGDVGSISIAFILLFALGMLMKQTGNYSYIVLLAVYGVDVVLTIIHRMMLHDNLGRAHRKHAYQLMANELRLPHLLVASCYALLQLVISVGAIISGINPYIYLIAVLLILSVVYCLFMRRYYHLHEQYLKDNVK